LNSSSETTPTAMMTTTTTPADELPTFNGTGSGAGNNETIAINNNGDPISASTLNGNHVEGDTNNNSNICGRNNYYGSSSGGGSAESEVERRNRINAQLSNPALNVATIFRDRNIRYQPTPTRANANYYAPLQHMMMAGRGVGVGGGGTTTASTTTEATANNNEINNRSRTNPRTDRQQRRHVNREVNGNNSNSINTINNNNNNPEYLYHEPVYHEDIVYGGDPYTSYNGHPNRSYQQQQQQPYILPEFTTFRNYNNLNNPHQPLYNNNRDSAMGSDSGYSQNTQNSGRGSLWGRRKRMANSNVGGGGGDGRADNQQQTPSAQTSTRDETSSAYEGS
jgi:hypothetical protein